MFYFTQILKNSRIIFITIVSTFFLYGCTSLSPAPLSKPESLKSATCPKIDYCFTPGQNCTQQIVAQLANAKSSILVQAYSFSSRPIADALINAKNRKVSVDVILDKSQLWQKSSLLHDIANAGIPVWIDHKLAIAHNKIMIIDGKIVITGSFNFTAAAQQRNAENLVFITDVQLSRAYVQNWEKRKSQSYPYKPSY